MLLVLPIILFRVSSLIVKNQDIFKQVVKVYDKAASNLEWKDRYLPSKIYTVMADFFHLIKEKGVISIPEIIVILGLFLDDLPRIFTSKEYDNLEDLSIIELGKQTGRKMMQVQTISETTIQKETDDAIQKNAHRTLDDTLVEIGNIKNTIELSNNLHKKSHQERETLKEELKQHLYNLEQINEKLNQPASL